MVSQRLKESMTKAADEIDDVTTMVYLAPYSMLAYDISELQKTNKPILKSITDRYDALKKLQVGIGAAMLAGNLQQVARLNKASIDLLKAQWKVVSHLRPERNICEQRPDFCRIEGDLWPEGSRGDDGHIFYITTKEVEQLEKGVLPPGIGKGALPCEDCLLPHKRPKWTCYKVHEILSNLPLAGPSPEPEPGRDGRREDSVMTHATNDAPGAPAEASKDM